MTHPLYECSTNLVNEIWSKHRSITHLLDGVQPTLSVDGIWSNTREQLTFWIVFSQHCQLMGSDQTTECNSLAGWFSQPCQLIGSSQTLESYSPPGWEFSQPCKLIGSGQTLESYSPPRWMFSQPCQLMRSGQTLESDSPPGWMFSRLCQLTGFG